WTQIYADDPDFKYGNSQIIKYQKCICFQKIRSRLALINAEELKSV
ncbi:hypothetical protein C5S35_02370, partial [Candidatus Methanophagaceae archaeon]